MGFQVLKVKRLGALHREQTRRSLCPLVPLLVLVHPALRTRYFHGDFPQVVRMFQQVTRIQINSVKPEISALSTNISDSSNNSLGVCLQMPRTGHNHKLDKRVQSRLTYNLFNSKRYKFYQTETLSASQENLPMKSKASTSLAMNSIYEFLVHFRHSRS